jgi:hypothetical protein
MKWTIQVELTLDGNKPITYDVGTITRPIADLSPEQIGLPLEGGPYMGVREGEAPRFCVLIPAKSDTYHVPEYPNAIYVIPVGY